MIQISWEKLAILGAVESFSGSIPWSYDPHPYEGVLEPLSGPLKNFEFILLEKSGHKPWIEKKAKERFYEILKQEI